ncbi:hypothetical protein ABWH88_04445 [Marinobacter adhaerens]|jgi:hypothetical protein|uniref:hypothetical protein n=1 Tax=Marinobacter TaxID=2742 RepID=UPI001C607000|nr:MULTISPECIES: hypothetical protein [Marinobacter]MBW4979746.1 hypothetical protein [Marinobacter adhaerens]MDC8456086.1 hypothetical protein [Marinobacter sp. DS40M6]|tara:strand:+ start:1893 stop:2084 length:192 start_codon:yes stop_codon:yes gene_type:complete
MGFFGAIIVVMVLIMIYNIFTKNDSETEETKRPGSFYLNEHQAARDGKIHQIDDDDGGPGHYM